MDPARSEFILLYELDGVPHEHALAEDRLVIGRAKDCNICFAFNAEVSRLHATLRATSEGWVVEDMSSRSGTFVNGEKITDSRPLRDRDVLTIGQIALTLREKRHETETVTVDGKTPLDLADAAVSRNPEPAAPPPAADADPRRSVETTPVDEPSAYAATPLPNFYDLIGAALFEPDAETIQEAAKKRLAELRSDSTPGYREQRQSEVDAIAAGLAAMSNPEKRLAFDTELAEQLGVEIEIRGGRVVPVGQEGFGQLTVGIAVVGLLLVLLWFALPWLRAALAPLFDVGG